MYVPECIQADFYLSNVPSFGRIPTARDLEPAHELPMRETAVDAVERRFNQDTLANTVVHGPARRPLGLRRMPGRSPVAADPVTQGANRDPRLLRRPQVERHVSPIPLDYIKSVAPKTPTVSSHGSELGYDSPSFPRTVKATLRDAIRRDERRLTARNLQHIPSYEGQINGQIAAWLEHTSLAGLEATEDLSGVYDLNDVKEPEGGRSPFYVRPDTREASVHLDNVRPQLPPRRALQDVSNLRNSWANPILPAKARAPSPLANFVPSSARAADFDRTLAILEGRPPERTASAARQVSPVRMADLARNLAILQGRRRR